METVHICPLSQQSLRTKGPVIVYRPWIGEFRGKAINNDHPLINQETKEIKTSVFLIHRVAVTITTRSFASGRRNIFYASAFTVQTLRYSFKITEKRWQGKKRMYVAWTWSYDLDTLMGINDLSTIYGEAEWKWSLAELLRCISQVSRKYRPKLAITASIVIFHNS